MRVATEVLLADFLREIRDVSIVRQHSDEQTKSRHSEVDSLWHPDNTSEKLSDLTGSTDLPVFISENDERPYFENGAIPEQDVTDGNEKRDTGGLSFTTS